MYQLAELNIARMLAPSDDPIMAEFMDNLAKINALAEQSPGFVWRFIESGGNATEVRPYDDPHIIINISVWESVDALYNYTYYSGHTDFFRRRADWFHKLDTPIMALWWVPAGHQPTVEEAKARLDHLTQHGPTPTAFTFKQRFPAPVEQPG